MRKRVSASGQLPLFPVTAVPEVEPKGETRRRALWGAVRALRHPQLHDTLKCCRCQEVKPLTAFISKTGKPLWACYDCVRSNSRRRYKEKGEKATRQSYETCLRRWYGITLEQYEQLSQQQNHLCAICGKPETAISKRLGVMRAMRLAVDHDSITGDIRGLLCKNCNTAIGSLAHDPDLARKAILYLERTAIEPSIPAQNRLGSVPVGGPVQLLPATLQEELNAELAEATARNDPWKPGNVASWMSERLGRRISYSLGRNYLMRWQRATQVSRPQDIRADA